MLTRSTTEQIDPDQQMVGKCMTCGTVVHCLMRDCRWLPDPSFGKVVCAGCPKVTGKRADGSDRLCDMRVNMSRAKERD